jgi:hypothetical protein
VIGDKVVVAFMGVRNFLAQYWDKLFQQVHYIFQL